MVILISEYEEEPPEVPVAPVAPLPIVIGVGISLLLIVGVVLLARFYVTKRAEASKVPREHLTLFLLYSLQVIVASD